MQTTVVTAPAQEPVSTSYVKSYLRVDWTDDDTLIADLITQARQWLELTLGRAFITQTLRAAMPLTDVIISPLGGMIGTSFDGYYTEIPQPPVQSVTTVEIESQIGTWVPLTSGTDYAVDTDSAPGRVYLAASALANWAVALTYPGAQPRVRVTWVAGYGSNQTDVPMDIRQNICQIVAWLYDHRGESDIPANLANVGRKVWRL